MSAEHLVQMLNDIGNFFMAEPVREEAIAGILNHVDKYWTHRMQEKLLEQARHDDTGLAELPREAVRRLAARAPKAGVSASAPPMPLRPGSR